MHKDLRIHIPQPCHEDWDTMIPEEKGRFCNACSKQVIDFADMSDSQVLNIFSKASTKICGRFAADQLQRTLKPAVEEKRKTWWVAAFMPLLFLFSKSDAQRKSCKTDSSIILPIKPAEIIMGKVLPPESVIQVDSNLRNPIDTVSVKGEMMLTQQIDASITTHSIQQTNTNNRLVIEGKVVDYYGNPVPYASVVIKTKEIDMVADSSGFFKIKFDDVSFEEIFILSITGYDFEPVEIKASAAEAINCYDEIAKNSFRKIVINDIVINRQYVGGTVVVVGGAVAFNRINTLDTIPALIRKAFNSQAFRMFPNPAFRGRDISIELKTKSRYTIQLFDNNSQLLSVKQGDGVYERSLISFTIPSDIVAGTYFICVIDEQKKKRYTNKILIQ